MTVTFYNEGSSQWVPTGHSNCFGASHGEAKSVLRFRHVSVAWMISRPLSLLLSLRPGVADKWFYGTMYPDMDIIIASRGVTPFVLDPIYLSVQRGHQRTAPFVMTLECPTWKRRVLNWSLNFILREFLRESAAHWIGKVRVLQSFIKQNVGWTK